MAINSPSFAHRYSPLFSSLLFEFIVHSPPFILFLAAKEPEKENVNTDKIKEDRNPASSCLLRA